MGGLTLFRAVLTVAVVLLAAFWCSRFLGKQWTRSSRSGNMQVLEQIQVGQSQRILLLKVGVHNYLVGVSQAGICLLTEVVLKRQDRCFQMPGQNYPSRS